MDFCMEKGLYAVIMAGGRGERFWPAGRIHRPKQLLSLQEGGRTMVEETVQRLFPLISSEHIFVMTNDSYVEQMREVLPIPNENVIGEPVGRDTAPCVALATALISRVNRNAIIIFLPADHFVRPAKVFQETLHLGAKKAEAGSIVTVGVMPNYPATGYGYLHLGDRDKAGFYDVEEFIEKPKSSHAIDFLLNGNYRWNSGIFIWSISTIRNAFQKHMPELSCKLEKWANGSDYRNDFAECQKISIDYAIMEKTKGVVAMDAPFSWNDIGTWSSFRSVLPLDEDGNAIRGNFLALEASNNVLLNDDPDTLIGVIGLHDIAVVKSGNGILVCPFTQEQKIRELVKKMNTTKWM